MPNYRRAFTPGATFFFTVVTNNRRPILTEPLVTESLRAAIRDIRTRMPFEIIAWVLLPDHLHAVWRMPQGDSDFSLRWALIKQHVTRACTATSFAQHGVNDSRRKRREGALWQRRFWEHRIRDDTDLARHVGYIHYNPVKHGHVRQVRDWPFSTFHRYCRAGIYPPDWGGSPAVEDDTGFGE